MGPINSPGSPIEFLTLENNIIKLKLILYHNKSNLHNYDIYVNKFPAEVSALFNKILRYRNAILRPNEMTQRDILTGAIAELLWKVRKLDKDATQLWDIVFFKVGDKKQAVIAIPEANPVFEPPVRFSIDGVTEKVVKFWKKLFNW